MRQDIRKTLRRRNAVLHDYVCLLIGAGVCVAGLQIFIVPQGLYNGGSVGISQIIRTLIIKGLETEPKYDLAGILNLLINIPIMLLAYRELSRSFFLRTCFTVGVQTLLLFLMKTDVILLTDTLTSCIVGGVIAGYGCGLILKAGGSGAGFDVLGVWLSKKRIHIGVGTIVMLLNGCVYLACALLFSFETAVYSIIYSLCCSLVINRVHTQNINCGVMIISRRSDLRPIIASAVRRGVTQWSCAGTGEHSEGEKTCYFVAVSKYETEILRRLMKEVDPEAFITVDENRRIYGNYARRLS